MSDEQRDELIERAMRGVRGLETHTPHGYDPASDDMTVEFAIKLSEQDAEIAHLRAELAAARSVLIRVDEWWTSLPYGLRQDIEGSGAVPCCIAAVLTALQSHRRMETTCPKCKGTGEVMFEKAYHGDRSEFSKGECPDCKGAGHRRTEEK